jgi:hypothetical protein
MGGVVALHCLSGGGNCRLMTGCAKYSRLPNGDFCVHFD